MLELCTLASGSGGNCALVTCGNISLLVDAGISARRITSCLSQFNTVPESLSGIFITHTHSDHISGLAVLMRRLSVPIYATRETCTELLGRIPGLSGHLHIIEPGAPVLFSDLSVECFPTSHDVPGSVGYTFTYHCRKACIVTDLGQITEPVLKAVLGSDLAVVETNHDVSWLKSGPYPPYLKRRILSGQGHLSNEDGAMLCSELASHGAIRLVLAHLSAQNNTPGQALRAVRARLLQDGIPPESVILEVALPDRCSDKWEV